MKVKKEPGKRTESVKEVFGELYEENFPKIFRYIYYRLRDTKMTEDLTSTVFEKALTKFNTYRSDKASFSTWLFSIARHSVIDHYRKKSREAVLNLDPKSEPTTGVDQLIKKEELKKLFFYLSELSDLEQETISLKFGSRLTNRRITKALALTESNVGTILYRAILKLRAKFLEGEDEKMER